MQPINQRQDGDTMGYRTRLCTGAARLAATACIGIAGFVAIVASGGGDIGAAALLDDCPKSGCAEQSPPLATAEVDPPRQTVETGTPATFTATVTGNAPTYQWQRSADGGTTFVDIAGATGRAYTLPQPAAGDDGTVFRVVVRTRPGAASAEATLHVSSLPPVAFEDTAFAVDDWQVAALPKPPGGEGHAEEQVLGGGNPDAWRRMRQTLPRGSVMHVLHVSRSAAYDPAAQGAIATIDHREDCSVEDGESAAAPFVYTSLVFEQAGRQYQLTDFALCTASAWTPKRMLSADALRFAKVSGPPCGAGEACPDFSATAPPLRFGYLRYTTAYNGDSDVTHGIDNWKVTVWRR